ncbi:MAG: hypothetical protein IJB70_03930 [Clostridia bacterium]|nr:hypothetical protein [Clostridia bacterium]
MKNKKKFFGIVVFLLVASIASFVILGSPMKENAAHPKEYTVEEFVSSVSFLNNYQSALSENSDMIRSYVSEYDAENLTYEEYMSIEAYIIFILENSPTDEELAIINSLMNEGHTIQTLSQIYEFYLTTNESPAIITEIAALENLYWGDNWIENAFNDITDNAHGVLDIEDVKAYLENVSLEDIQYANILCRKGKYTIDEILQQKINGTSWDEITLSVYSNVSTGNITMSSNSKINAINTAVSQSNISFNENPMQSYELAGLLSKHVSALNSDYITKENADEIISLLQEEQDNALVDSVNEILKSFDLPTSFMNYEQQKEYFNTNNEIAKENGLKDKDILLLRQKGFSMAEIAEESCDYDGKILHLLTKLKSAREVA